MQASAATENPANSLSSLRFFQAILKTMRMTTDRCPLIGARQRGPHHRELGGPMPLLMVFESRRPH